MRQDDNSQTKKALLTLRQLILEGSIEPDKRLSEVRAVELTGVSRTPARAALQRLAEEGLVREREKGGYEVQRFTERTISDAIEIRGSLEGLAARFAAERGVDPADITIMRDLTEEMDARLLGADLDHTAFDVYAELNAKFHTMLAAFADSAPLRQSLERAVSAPFASPSAFIAVQGVLPEARRLLTVANDQHKCVLDAIEAKEGARAEALMREHARLAMRNLKLALANADALDVMPGGGLILQLAQDV
jgi:GntR family transcriptional regulator of vanillate catabolism